MTDECNAVVDGRIPEDWIKSWLVNVYKGKGDALACGLYRGIKLIEHAVKVLERVIEGRVRKIVMAFVDLEKVFRVPREVVWWALRYMGVDDWIMSVIR